MDLRRYVDFALLVTLILLLPTAILLNTEFGQPGPTTYLEIATGVVFSGLIAMIYIRQNNILERQTELSKLEAEIMRGDHVPILGVESSDFGISGGKPDPCESSETPPTAGQEGTPWAWLIISNLGNEIAEDIHLRVLLRYDQPEEAMSANYRDCSQPLDNISMISQTSGGEGSVLPPESDEKFMRTALSLKKQMTGGTHPVPLSQVVQKLVCEKEVVTDIGFVLEFKNTAGTPHSMLLDPAYRFEPSQFGDNIDFGDPDLAEEYSIKDLVQNVQWTPPERRDTEPDEIFAN